MEKENMPLAAVDFSEFVPQTYDEWKEEATASLKGAPFDKKLLTKTYEGITLQPLYTAADAEDFAANSGFPGSGYYLRGADAAGYNGRPWLIAQAVKAHSVEETNKILAEELAKGATAINFHPCHCFDKEDGEEIARLFKGIDITQYPFQVHTGCRPAKLLQLIHEYTQQQAIDSKKITGIIGADPLGSLARHGYTPIGMAQLYDDMAAAITWTEQHMPQVKTIFIQGKVYHEGGADAVQELAAVFCTAIEYLDALTERGLTVEQIAAKMSFSFALGANFFMEIAKLRAARMIWAQIIGSYGGSEQAAKLDARAGTSRFTATVYDPYVNILRGTTQAFSGVVGGINGLTVEPFDTAVRHSDEQSRRIARNIQVMMENEFNLTSPVDPAGGSWYVETLTGQVAEAAWNLLQKTEAEGGMLQALQKGSIQEAIAGTLEARFKKLATRADRAVGSNMYANPLEKRLGEGCGCSHGNKGEQGSCGCGCHKEAGESVTAIHPRRWTEQYEALRIATEEHKDATGKEIEVFLANMGPIPQHKARADFSAGFMEVGGFKVLRNNGFATVEEAAKAAIASKATATVICSTDDTYPELVPAIAKAIKAQAPAMMVILAGMPAAEHKDAYVAAGVDEFIHIKANCLQILEKIQQAGGIK